MENDNIPQEEKVITQNNNKFAWLKNSWPEALDTLNSLGCYFYYWSDLVELFFSYN